MHYLRKYVATFLRRLANKIDKPYGPSILEALLSYGVKVQKLEDKQ